MFQCNFIELTGTSVGFWQAMDEINGNFEKPGRYECVSWTSEQVESFDTAWNYGRYGGPFLFALSCLVTFMLSLTMCMELHPDTEQRLAFLQFVLSILSGSMLSALNSSLCDEYDCWLDIGGVLTVAASVILLIGSWITLSLRFAPQEKKDKKGKKLGEGSATSTGTDFDDEV